MDKAIEVRHLTKSYGAFLAVDHIAFDVSAGEIFGFLWPNGAGKSTTQRMLTTLLQPTAGTVRICRYDLSRSPYPAKRRMGLMPGESNSLSIFSLAAGPCQAWVFILTSRGIRKRGYSHEVPAALNVPEHAISSIAFQTKVFTVAVDPKGHSH